MQPLDKKFIAPGCSGSLIVRVALGWGGVRVTLREMRMYPPIALRDWNEASI
ncbi:hypothetical protein CES85_3411 (plasmid) [Ochrobactrum quorumnocens]|uniref:Uncharacterized protein n=1 Tax=Ochrobactrum quorumnocens TaxID=271865 RepID=A0A248UNK8_9HYPH|nr:hypothetical protein CES85_3411 [[Ochrobactrum] quorumnocens]